jgi:hypothetical protein
MFLFGACSYVASIIFPFLGYSLVITAIYGEPGVLPLYNQKDRLKWAAFGWTLFSIGLLLGPVAYGVIHVSDWINHGDWFGALAVVHILAAAILTSVVSDYASAARQKANELKETSPRSYQLSRS